MGLDPFPTDDVHQPLLFFLCRRWLIGSGAQYPQPQLQAQSSPFQHSLQLQREDRDRDRERRSAEHSATHSQVPSPTQTHVHPTDDAIEAIIQQATAARSGDSSPLRVLEVRLDRMVGEGGAVGYEQQLGQQQHLGGQQQYGGIGQMVQQMLSPSMGLPQLGLSGAHAYAKHKLGLGSLSGPGSPSVGGSSTPASMSASMSGSGSASTSGSRPSLPTSVSASLTGGSGGGMVDDDGARRSPLSFAYQLHAQGQGQTQDMAQSRNLFVGNVSLLLQILDFIRCRCILHTIA